jgi:hypothetical protein
VCETGRVGKTIEGETMIRFVFFDCDNITEVCECEDPLTKSGKFIAPIQTLFNQVMRGELDTKVIIERVEKS